MGFKVTINYGYSELKEERRFENGKMSVYGYRIDYDRNGNETGRTEPSFISAIGWGDGTPFTEEDYKNISKL